jgi:hypothetical protein
LVEESDGAALFREIRKAQIVSRYPAK